MINTIPESISKYKIIKPLGSGAFGQVYHVLDTALNAQKAIKVLLSSDTSKFLRDLQEAQIQHKCQHKHIVSINEANIFVVSGSARVVLDLEYIPEGSLEDALSARWVSVRESIEYIRGALFGLEHAHANGFLHRDVKPGNILLAPSTPKLSDFGLATDAGATLAGSAKGYKTHLPPEFYKNGITTEQTDIFAMGITLFRSLSNIADWHDRVQGVRNSLNHMQNGTLVQNIGFAEFLPVSIRRIVLKACHSKAEKRYPSAKAFGQDLDKLRFNVNWFRLDEYSWQGECIADKKHTCCIDPATCAVTVATNGRRNRSECRTYGSLGEAVNRMQSYIAKTTLV